MGFICSSHKIELLPGDIVLVKGNSWISRLIRIATRHVGEKRTKVNHVGMIIGGGTMGGAPYEGALIIEAISKVKVRTLSRAYGPPKRNEVAVYRAINLTGEERIKVAGEAYSHLGQPYGWKRVVCLTLDQMIFGAYLFRRLIRNRSPICSWLVAHAYSKVGKHFGVGPDSATPDDIWDFVAEREGTPYICVYPLSKLGGV